MNNPLNTAFRGWKIVLAIFVGLSISGWMLYRSISTERFVSVSPNSGTHIWVDGNDNHQVDFDLSEDFQEVDNGDYRRKTLGDVLGQIDWNWGIFAWLGTAFLFMVGRDFFYIVRIRLLTQHQLSWRAGFYVIMLWEFASALSPGVVGGAAIAMFILNRETIPFGKATAIVIVTTFMDNLFYVVMIPLMFVFIHHDQLFPIEETGTEVLSWWFWAGFSVIFFICLLLYLTIFWYPTLATRFLLFIFRLPFLKRWKFIAQAWGKDIEMASKEFRREPRQYWLKVFLITAGSWISRYLVVNAILNAFLDLGFFENVQVLGRQLVLWLFMLVSFTPGGSGFAEYGFSTLLADFSTSAILLAGMAVLWRLISYFPYLFLGSFLLPKWIQRVKK